ncbi:MAG: peptidoglycan-binding protein [Calothrix sp. C42_A2020_038]|nr:peptidoglycan-binding protein [Calothrix sp. C42_A2020_038]
MSVIPLRFFTKNYFYLLLLCSFVPLLFGSPSVASVTVEQQIAQAIPVGGIRRPNLKIGSQGDAVSELQAALKLMGYFEGAVDGNYGQTTATAVSQFKQSAGLAPDGIVDAATWQVLFPGQIADSPFPPQALSTSTSTNSVTTSTTISNKFPVPNQTAANLPRPVVVSNQQSNSNTRNTSTQQETVRTTTRAVSNNNSTQNTRREQSTSTNTNATNRTTRVANTTNSIRNNTNASGRTASSTSTSRTRRVDETRKPGIQYTAAGFPILRLGMRGEEVYDLQTRLQRLGYLKSTPDGNFGATTEAAVKALQQRFGIEADGIAGGETWEILTRRRAKPSQS